MRSWKSAFLSQGPGNAEYEPRNRPLEMSKWISEASKRVLPNHVGLDKAREMATNGFRCYKIKFFGPCMAREMPNISFGCRFWRASNPKQRKSRHGTVITPAALKIHENARFSYHVWKKREERNARWITQKRKKRPKTPGFRWVLKHGRPPKAPESRLDPQVGSGKAKKFNEAWEPRNTHKVRVHIQKNTRTRVVFAMFYKNRIKAS